MDRRIMVALLVLAVIAGPQVSRLQAQSSVPPQTYSFTQDPTLFSMGGPMVTKVARDGSKKVVEHNRVPSADIPEAYQDRILYDFQAHKIYTAVLSDKTAPCSVVTYTDPAAPFTFDPISGVAEFMKEMTNDGKQQFKQVSTETVNGVAAKVMEYTAPPPDKSKGRLWLAQQGNYPIKLVYIAADGKQQTLFELKNLSLAKPPASAFTPPTGCIAVSGTANAHGGDVVLPSVAPDASSPTASAPATSAPPSSSLPIGSARLARPPVVSKNGALTLQADNATTKEIEFSWAGNPAGACNLEQKTGPPPDKWPTVATSSNGKVTDSKIGPYATNVYRVTCGTKTSNEVTVGPPPAGFHTITPRPDNRQDTALGKFISPVLDGNGDPAVVFLYNDPNGDGRSDDAQLMFVSWDRAAYQWKEPVVVATAPNFDPRPPAPCVSLTRDAQTGTYGVAWVDALDNKTVHMAISHDDGATWAVKTAFNNAQTSAGPNLVFSGGKAYLTLEQDRTMQVIWTSGGIDEDPLQWHGGFAPMLPGNNGVSRALSLALDDKGIPAIAYWQKVNNGNLWTLAFWRLGVGTPVKVADTGTANYPPDGVILAFAGSHPRIMLDSRLDRTQISSHYSTFSNDGGATWSQPLPVPDDGNEHIGGYMSFAVSKEGHAAFAGDVAGGNTDRMKCSWPKLARSKDLTEWTTCAPQGAQYPMIRTIWGSVIYSPSGLLYMMFQNRQTNPQQGLPAGLIIWGGQ